MADPKPESKSADKATHLAVRAQRDGFRRAGRAWSAEETTVPLADFSKEQIAALEAEPLLAVERVAKPAKKAGESQGVPAGKPAI